MTPTIQELQNQKELLEAQLANLDTQKSIISAQVKVNLDKMTKQRLSIIQAIENIINDINKIDAEQGN